MLCAVRTSIGEEIFPGRIVPNLIPNRFLPRFHALPVSFQGQAHGPGKILKNRHSRAESCRSAVRGSIVLRRSARPPPGVAPLMPLLPRGISLLSDPGRPLRSHYNIPICTDPPARKISFRNHTFRAGAACACTAGQKKCKCPLPDPPQVPVQGKSQKTSPEIPQETKAFSPHPQKGVGQGQDIFFRGHIAIAAEKTGCAGGGKYRPFSRNTGPSCRDIFTVPP